MRSPATRLAICVGLAAAAALAVEPVRVGPVAGGQPARAIAADVTGWKTLALTATGYPWGQAVWGEPVLVAADGSRARLADLTPTSVYVGWGEFRRNSGHDGRPLTVGGRAFAHGLFAHADSEVVYALDGRYTRFEAWVGVDQLAETRGRVTFEVRRTPVAGGSPLQQGFIREALASLRRVLDQHPGHPDLAARLTEYDRDFATLRAGLDAGTEATGERLAGFPSLVRDIRLLQLDAPLLFVKRHAYFSPHIYDDHLTWHPGGGIYMLENPAAPPEQQVVRAVIDPATRETLGPGVYRDPDLSPDATRLLFAFKGTAQGDTSIHEIGLAPSTSLRAGGDGLRRLTDPGRDGICHEKPAGLFGAGGHDHSPCYLPDGRVAFVSTRTEGLVMCFNNHISTLHTMNADGSDLRPISVNNVTEFDPTVLPDGRLLFGRWEYVDKTALYMQSLWSVNPDGTHERALFKNNLAKPTAVLDARPVPGSSLIVASLTPHNGQSVGAIAMLDPALGKNNLAALSNFTPEYPTEMDQGLSHGPSDPWPLDGDAVLIANNAPNRGAHSVIELIDRFGFRFVIRREPDIGCFSPMLVKPHAAPAVIPSMIRPEEPAKFLLHDVYAGLDGVARGTVKQLRVLETTSRVSGVPPGGRWWNQAFLLSWQGSYDVKRFLGVVPVEADGSAYFEAPPGKALYVQALDGEGRLVQSMRTFVQAAPGVTRSCFGCHVNDEDRAPVPSPRPLALAKPAAKLQPEAWGAGFLEYPTRVQPVLDRNCVSCHGGAKDIAGGIDLSGGWTWAFNLSYETLLKNTLAGFLNCNNGSVRTAEILLPRTHGSGAAPLATLLAGGHGGRLKEMPEADRALLRAWMDGNGNYYGSWDYTSNATCQAILEVRAPLLGEMEKAGCVSCHPREIGSDWVNLQTPAHSRILRAPLATGSNGIGLGWCRSGKARPVRYPLVTQAHQPPDVFRPSRAEPLPTNGAAVATFANEQHAGYRAMLAAIEQVRARALQSPRVDMPGAVVVPGRCRELAPLSPPRAVEPIRKPASQALRPPPLGDFKPLGGGSSRLRGHSRSGVAKAREPVLGVMFSDRLLAVTLEPRR